MESHHGEPTEAPLLKFNYSTGSAETNSQKVGLRFQDIAIPQGATITSAYLEFTAAVSSSDNASMLIQANLAVTLQLLPQLTTTSLEHQIAQKPLTL